MTTINDPRIETWVRDALGQDVRIARRVRLTGGLSEAMFRLDLAGAAVPAVVLRRWPSGDAWQQDASRREALALSRLAGTGVPAPALLASDPQGRATGRPSTLMSLLPGDVVLDPADRGAWVRAMADQLARIHALPCGPDVPSSSAHDHLGDPWRRAWLAGFPAGARALELALAVRDPAAPVLCHGDYQHFNLLWQDGAICGVVDWTMAGSGDPGRDLGHCMLNLAVLHEAADALALRARYEELADRSVDIGWLLWELIGFSPDWEEFIPVQVHGRAPLDVPGMRGRVEEVITALVRGIG
ncbi:phosphotransferase family protein [Brachybacterium hainanense]|uniref:Phosphotransferase family protein n=1 Tax=Brachybacterium hainanense TaxID=1541174 RepID=A0ABV6R9U6_9MICO